MHSSTILTAVLAAGLTTGLPHHHLHRRQAQPSNPATVTCTQSGILAQGIALNIADQEQELATANNMAALLAANPVDTVAWGQQRTALLQFVNNGIAIRQANQLITPPGNPSLSGVATVANAQLTELSLSTNLTVMGSDNVAGNMAIVKMLQNNFSGGIVQNQKNMADAMQGCGSGATAVSAPAPAAAPGPAEPAPATPAPAEPKPAEPKPAEPKPAEPKPAEPKPAEPQPATPASAPEGKPSSNPAAEPKPSSNPAAEPKPSSAAAPGGAKEGAGNAARASAVQRAVRRGEARLRLAGVGAA